jgi:hypothetical protein
MLRAGLLPPPLHNQAGDKLREYLDLRVEAGGISLDNTAERDAVLRKALDVQKQLWELGTRAVQENPSPVPSGLFIQSLNDLIDAYGLRDAALKRHVPEIVLFLLFGAFALTACLVGYASGIARHRASFPTYILVILITFLVFLIIDLDRPRRGLIEVSQQSLVDLQVEQDR